LIQDLLFILHDEGKLKLASNAFETMIRFVQNELTDPESGGIMVGRLLLEDANCIIDDVSTPLPMDIQKRNGFFRKPDGHQDFFDVKWKEYEGRCFYLGEWHTHPEPIPSPSLIDMQTWKKLLQLPLQGTDFLYFIIIGTEQLKIWKGTNHNNKIRIGFVGGIKRNGNWH
jgi:integrative and conjugative element protein (TIGR02256 family)